MIITQEHWNWEEHICCVPGKRVYDQNFGLKFFGYLSNGKGGRPNYGFMTGNWFPNVFDNSLTLAEKYLGRTCTLVVQKCTACVRD